MKILSIVVPCYNSESYMRHALDTLLVGGGDVEILIVNDGSSDSTAAIADEYQSIHPDIVRAIHQENGGHGAAVMSGIAHATGLYFKVVDSDDWVDEAAYLKILCTLKDLRSERTLVDMLVSNYVYDKIGVTKKRTMQYGNVLPEGRVLTWNDVGRFHKGQYILMHSVIYRLALLRECGLELPRHTFYVDELYVYSPLPWVKTLYYLDVNFYHYFIGREDQSVQESVMIRRIDQQIRVTMLMLEQVDLDGVRNPRLRRYMFNYLEILTVISSILLIRSGTPENLQKKQRLWQHIKQNNPRLYNKLRYGIMGQVIHLPGRPGRGFAVTCYKISQKAVGFN